MFYQLKRKWKVDAVQLSLILCTFAVGGSLTGFTGKKLMQFIPVDHPAYWWIIYVVIISILWPLSILLTSLPLGQFRFFQTYLNNMARKTGLLRLFSGKNSSDKSSAALSTDSATGILTGKANAGRRNLAIFASGAGSNAKKIIEYFRDSSLATVALIVSNKADAGVLAIAKEMGIPTLVIEKEPFFRGDAYSSVLERFGIHFIILAGFLWKVPEKLIRAYPRRIINIHPALLPQFGGKGMYGAKVHEAVLQAGEKESGITIHYVDELYDHGDIIFQARCPVYPHDNPETLADRIHELEHASYPRVIADLLLPMNKPD